MIPELGLFMMILALASAVLMSGSIFYAGGGAAIARRASYICFVLLAVSFGVLIFSFVVDDFSSALVFQHSDVSQPLFYKVVAAWGNHEGSLLLSCLILAFWTMLLQFDKKFKESIWFNDVIAVLGFLQLFLLSFLIFFSNPFERILVYPERGQGLNPLLQDALVSSHPPIFYLGYFGLAVPFAFGVSACLRGKAGRDWACMVAPWMWIMWSFSIAGIALGSIWSYYELGWGGFWAWDPVENAAIMPWLITTAATHAMVILYKRSVGSAWAVFLCLLAFSLSLAGLFIVRSGLIDSVHSFSDNPARGLYILTILAVFCGGSFILYALRARKFVSSVNFSLFCRETLMLVSQFLLLSFVVVILLGTLYPIFAKVIFDQDLAVGAPWFQRFTWPIAALISLLIMIAPIVSWRRFESFYNKKYIIALAVSGFILPLFGAILFYISDKDLQKTIIVAVTSGFAFLYFCGIALDFMRKKSFPSGMMLARMLGHVAVLFWIVSFPAAFMLTKDSQSLLKVSQSAEVFGQKVQLLSVDNKRHYNYSSLEAKVIYQDQEFMTSRRYYGEEEDTETTEMSIKVGLWSDVTVTLGRPNKDYYPIYIGVRPMMIWVWIGFLFFTLSGFIAARETFKKRVIYYGKKD